MSQPHCTVHRIVTERIVALLEAGVCPWRRPWRTMLARNLVSGHEYQGANWLLLNSLGFASPHFVTYRQAQSLGGNVKKGEHGFPVVFWKFLDKEDAETGERKRIPLLRYYTVFNLEQTEGIPSEKIPSVSEASPVSPPAVQVPDTYPGPTPSLRGGSLASYSPSSDTITLPPGGSFESSEAYFRTFAHELTHSTGHKSRLSRFENPGQFVFSSGSYSREELTAEMGAAFLCQETGVSSESGLENSAAYIGSWLRMLKQTKNGRLVVEAAGKAQKAVNFILGRSNHEDTEN